MSSAEVLGEGHVRSAGSLEQSSHAAHSSEVPVRQEIPPMGRSTPAQTYRAIVRARVFY